MKKVITFLMIAMILMSMLGLIVSADDTTDQGSTEDTTNSNTPVEDPDASKEITEPEEADPPANDEGDKDFLSRIIESFTKGQATDIVSLAFSVFVVVLMTVLKNSTKTSLSDLTSLFSRSDESSKLRVNKLIDLSSETIGELSKFAKQYSEGQIDVKTYIENQVKSLNSNVNERVKELEKKI